MEYAGIKRIIIGEEGEYGRRLARYLERKLPERIRLVHCTREDYLPSPEDGGDIYILGDAFYERAMRGENWEGNRRDLIHLTYEDCDGEQDFCRYHAPGELLEQIRNRGQPCLQEETDYKSPGTSVVGLYSPVYEKDLLEIAAAFLTERDLFLGVEDLGDGLRQEPDMGDLCYYIHLREEKILSVMDSMLQQTASFRYLKSPAMYFYLRELTPQDYQWFFSRLRTAGCYEKIMFGMGNGFASDPAIFSMFDRLILIDSRDSARQHRFCERMREFLNGEFCAFRGQVEMACKEDLLVM